MLILLILGLGAGAFFLFGQGLLNGDGGADEVAAPTPTVSPPPISMPEPGDIMTTPPRFSFFAGRNPFLPLVVAPEGGGGSGTTQPRVEEPRTGGGQQEPGEPTEPPAGQNGGAGSGTDGGGGGGQQAGNSRRVGGHTVTLIDVFSSDGKERAQVRVDNKTYVVEEGATFSDNFKVVSIDGSCAAFLHGDERFTLCT
ncbi:MAG: hypothetical protein ACRDH6_01220 [Actinomycetota bacterium]